MNATTNDTTKVKMNFAPVIIPTLCRYEHLKQCLNSLSQCTYANETDVYIGLDYPFKEEQWNGYKQISKFLATFNKKCFKSFTVIKRPYNYGFGPNGNIRTLQTEILKIYDCFIFSEDDNIFAPNFLDYINKGLEKFKYQNNVFAICGYRHYYPIKYQANTFYRQNVDFSAWGYAIWKDRYEDILSKDYKYFRNKAFSITIWKKLLNNGNYRLTMFLSYTYSKWNRNQSDNLYSVYAAINDMDVIMPSKVSLVRNIGIDGSGINFRNASKELKNLHLNQPIDSEKFFQYHGTGYEYYKENKKIHKNYSYAKVNYTRLVINIIKFIIKQILSPFYK